MLTPPVFYHGIDKHIFTRIPEHQGVRIGCVDDVLNDAPGVIYITVLVAQMDARDRDKTDTDSFWIQFYGTGW